MSDTFEGISQYRELLTQLTPDADEALKLIKDGKHKEGYDKIIDIMNRCEYSHPEAWAYMSVLTIRQAAAKTEVSYLKPAEKGFKRAVEFQAHIFESDDSLFDLGKTIFDNINKYSDIYRLKVKADTSSTVMRLLDDAKAIPDNGYNSTRQKEQLNDLQKKIDKVKDQGSLDISTSALGEIAVYEKFLTTVKELDAYGEKSSDAAKDIGKKLNSIESFDKNYLLDVVSASIKTVRELIAENISQSRKADERKKSKEREEAVNRYWAENPERKAELERSLDEANKGMREIDEQLVECEAEYMRISKTRSKFTSSVDSEKQALEQQLIELNDKMNNLGRFKRGDKKDVQSQIDEVQAKLDELSKKIADERKAYNESIEAELNKITEKKKDLAARDNELSSRIKQIKEELFNVGI